MRSQSLVTLYASNNSITSISGLYGCIKLKTLNVDNNFIKEISMVILYMNSLTDFSFTGNPITDNSAYIKWKDNKGEIYNG